MQTNVIGKYPVLNPSGQIESHRILMSDGSTSIEPVATIEAKPKAKDPSKFFNLQREREETKVIREELREIKREKETITPKEKKEADNDITKNPVGVVGGGIGKQAGAVAAQTLVPGGTLPVVGSVIGSVGGSLGEGLGKILGNTISDTFGGNKEAGAHARLLAQEAEEERARQEAMDEGIGM